MAVRITKEEYFDRLFSKFPEHKQRFDYSCSNFSGIMEPLVYKCNVCGYLNEKQRASDHLKGDKCPSCSKKLRKSHESFMKELLDNQPDFLESYTLLSEYVNSQTAIKVQCNHCGFLTSKKPCRMLQGSSCKGCAMWTIPEVEEALRESQPTFTFEKITDPHHEALVTATCENGHVMVRQMGRFLRNRGCRECVFERLRTHGNRVPEALSKHPNLILVSVSGNMHDSSITLQCSDHGEFTKPLRGFIKGQGCPKCALSKLSPQSLTLANRRKDEWLKTPCDFYFLSIKSNSQSFYKFGISTDIKTRLTTIKRGLGKDYQVELIYKLETDKYSAVILEKELEFIERSKTCPSFAGYTETFNMSEDDVSDLIEYSEHFLKCQTSSLAA